MRALYSGTPAGPVVFGHAEAVVGPYRSSFLQSTCRTIRLRAAQANVRSAPLVETARIASLDAVESIGSFQDPVFTASASGGGAVSDPDLGLIDIAAFDDGDSGYCALDAKKSSSAAFIEACRNLRFWDRQTMVDQT